MKNKKFNPHTLLSLSILAGAISLMLSAPEAYAVNSSTEMGASVTRLNNLLGGHIMNAIMGVGIAGSVVIALMKSSLIPLGVGIGAGILYGFAKTWIDAVFTLCV
ncbi:MAG: hypothetical protein BGO67_08540 [Alphaproteobacteria bacterium 41-28]|nr:MAG: hypothetical protein BGO67_08540 [Alphaproteobacteria bacterium 41-28]